MLISSEVSMKIVLATQNKGKLQELLDLTVNQPELDFIDFLSLSDFGDLPLIEENGSSFYENALIKAKSYSQALHMPVIAEDSGLVVPALQGAPGIYSARYVGENATDQSNNDKLLSRMEHALDFSCYYQSTTVFYLDDNRNLSATGRCYGEITQEPRGQNGFGYDPLFFLPEKGKTMAELTVQEKNKLSHRHHSFSLLIKKIIDSQIIQPRRWS